MDELEVLQHYCHQARQGVEAETAAKEALTACFDASNRLVYVQALAQITDVTHLSFIYKAFMAIDCKVRQGLLKKRLIEQAIVQTNLLVLQMFFKDGAYRSYCPVDAHIMGTYMLSMTGKDGVKPIERSLSVDSVHNRRIAYSQSATAYYRLKHTSDLTQDQQAIITFLAEKIDPLPRQRVQVSKSESGTLEQPLMESTSDSSLCYKVEVQTELQTAFLPFWFKEQKRPSSDSSTHSNNTSTPLSESLPALVAPKPIRAINPQRSATPPRTQLSATDLPSVKPKSPLLFTPSSSPTYRPGSPSCRPNSPFTPPPSPFRPVY